MPNSYSAESIQVLSGLDPVRRRPGMYTDTTRPDHMVMEVVDNSVDEVISGYATEVEVTLFADGSVEVLDDGRGMPVDVHPEHKLTGVELILTKLHAGAKFDRKNYSFSGGLHGVGVSVVNALSSSLEVEVKRDGGVYSQRFENGDPVTTLETVGSVGKRNTGTRIVFKPNPVYFDAPTFGLAKLRHVLRAKAVLCPGLRVSLTVEEKPEQTSTETWLYESGLAEYLGGSLLADDPVLAQPFVHSAKAARRLWTGPCSGSPGRTRSWPRAMSTSCRPRWGARM